MNKPTKQFKKRRQNDHYLSIFLMNFLATIIVVMVLVLVALFSVAYLTGTPVLQILSPVKDIHNERVIA